MWPVVYNRASHIHALIQCILDLIRFMYVCIVSINYHSGTQQEVPEGDNSHTLLFSSLPPELNKSELAIFCETRGENVEIKSLDILGGGKARAVVSGLTSEGMLTDIQDCAYQ